MEKVKDQYLALAKLEEFQQAKQLTNSQENPPPVFLTWPTLKFGTLHETRPFAQLNNITFFY